MYPWFAMGHLKSFLELANKLAQKHIHTSLILPHKTALKLASDNHYPSLITFIPITVPQVEGIPPGVETTVDVPLPVEPFLMAAMDMTQETIDSLLTRLKPDIVLCDFAHWLPEMARKHGAKSLYYLTTYLMGTLYINAQARNLPITHHYTEAELMEPPPCFPSQLIRLKAHEASYLASACSMPCGGGMTLLERLSVSFRECDAIAVKSCKEMEGAYCDLAKEIFGKPVFLTGPVCPDPSSVSILDDHLNGWLNGFGQGSVIYCALGSECVLTEEQFREFVLGLELIGMPFLAALKPPTGYNKTESALPEGFAEKIRGRGMIYNGWVQQKLILEHPSVGCFVTHCGAGSLTEAIMSRSQIVMIPQAVDQFCNARLMSLELKIGVEVKTRAEDGFYDRHAIKNAISKVMDSESDLGKEVRINHSNLRRIMSCKHFQECYTNTFVENLKQLLEGKRVGVTG
ncbi:cyanidin 3-O-galactoside 2''-O-xylosyltransferase FGGT1-like [Silene latifolia]|uniref:cyanidin 3-O-galactoside 2''-O-xylosyltransferase FGGT1-like n=1 Tax=Silene latifolia TaxID=37657 RepID=UPI003D77673F